MPSWTTEQQAAVLSPASAFASQASSKVVCEGLSAQTIITFYAPSHRVLSTVMYETMKNTGPSVRDK